MSVPTPAICTAPARPSTTCCVELLAVVPPSPACNTCGPQQVTVPSRSNAQVLEICKAVDTPCTTTGFQLSEVVPSPNAPTIFCPQHLAVPSVPRAPVSYTHLTLPTK